MKILRKITTYDDHEIINKDIKIFDAEITTKNKEVIIDYKDTIQIQTKEGISSHQDLTVIKCSETELVLTSKGLVNKNMSIFINKIGKCEIQAPLINYDMDIICNKLNYIWDKHGFCGLVCEYSLGISGDIVSNHLFEINVQKNV